MLYIRFQTVKRGKKHKKILSMTKHRLSEIFGVEMKFFPKKRHSKISPAPKLGAKSPPMGPGLYNTIQYILETSFCIGSEAKASNGAFIYTAECSLTSLILYKGVSSTEIRHCVTSNSTFIDSLLQTK